jgi:hypothetical protein
MAATVRASYFGANASEPAGASAEGGIKFNREDTQSGTTPVEVPTSTGTEFSWIKQIALEVTATDTTDIDNRRVYLGGAPTSGLKVHFKNGAAYDQADSGNMPTASGSAGAVPAGYTEVSTTPQVYDADAVAAGSTGRNGDFCVLVAGASNGLSAGSAVALPDILIVYDEA